MGWRLWHVTGRGILSPHLGISVLRKYSAFPQKTFTKYLRKGDTHGLPEASCETHREVGEVWAENGVASSAPFSISYHQLRAFLPLAVA